MWLYRRGFCRSGQGMPLVSLTSCFRVFVWQLHNERKKHSHYTALLKVVIIYLGLFSEKVPFFSWLRTSCESLAHAWVFLVIYIWDNFGVNHCTFCVYTSNLYTSDYSVFLPERTYRSIEINCIKLFCNRWNIWK